MVIEYELTHTHARACVSPINRSRDDFCCFTSPISNSLFRMRQFHYSIIKTDVIDVICEKTRRAQNTTKRKMHFSIYYSSPPPPQCTPNRDTSNLFQIFFSFFSFHSHQFHIPIAHPNQITFDLSLCAHTEKAFISLSRFVLSIGDSKFIHCWSVTRQKSTAKSISRYSLTTNC